jgi:hypothetical protein
MVLGTNDSAGSVKGLEKNIDNIVRAADSRNIKLIWVGPPCVRKGWDKNSRDLDAMLTTRLASTSVKYISIRSDAALCSGQYTGGDGVHMNFTGYSIMWNMARAAAGLPDNESVKVAAVKRKPASDDAAPRRHTMTAGTEAASRRHTMTASNEAPTRRKKQIARSEPEPFSFFSFFRRTY